MILFYCMIYISLRLWAQIGGSNSQIYFQPQIELIYDCYVNQLSAIGDYLEVVNTKANKRMIMNKMWEYFGRTHDSA